MADFPEISKKDKDKFFTETCDIDNCNHQWSKHEAKHGGLYCPICEKVCVKTPPMKKRK